MTPRQQRPARPTRCGWSPPRTWSATSTSSCCRRCSCCCGTGWAWASSNWPGGDGIQRGDGAGAGADGLRGGPLRPTPHAGRRPVPVGRRVRLDPLFPTYAWLIGGAAIAGVANSVYHPSDYAILGSVIEPSRVGRAFSVHTFAGFLGGAIAPAVMVLLASTIGLRPRWRSPRCWGPPSRYRCCSHRARTALTHSMRPRSATTRPSIDPLVLSPVDPEPDRPVRAAEPVVGGDLDILRGRAGGDVCAGGVRPPTPPVRLPDGDGHRRAGRRLRRRRHPPPRRGHRGRLRHRRGTGIRLGSVNIGVVLLFAGDGRGGVPRGHDHAVARHAGARRRATRHGRPRVRYRHHRLQYRRRNWSYAGRLVRGEWRATLGVLQLGVLHGTHRRGGSGRRLAVAPAGNGMALAQAE